MSTRGPGELNPSPNSSRRALFYLGKKNAPQVSGRRSNYAHLTDIKIQPRHHSFVKNQDHWTQALYDVASIYGLGDGPLDRPEYVWHFRDLYDVADEFVEDEKPFNRPGYGRGT